MKEKQKRKFFNSQQSFAEKRDMRNSKRRIKYERERMEMELKLLELHKPEEVSAIAELLASSVISSKQPESKFEISEAEISTKLMIHSLTNDKLSSKLGSG